MILENSTRAGTKQAVQRPASLLRVSGASQPSLSVMALTGPAPIKQKKNSYIPAHRKAGRAAGERAHLGEGRFLLERGDLCCSPSRATH